MEQFDLQTAKSWKVKTAAEVERLRKTMDDIRDALTEGRRGDALKLARMNGTKPPTDTIPMTGGSAA